MRINAFIAQASGLSRRAADQAISDRRVRVNGQPATIGQTINPEDAVTLDDHALQTIAKTTTIVLNKPTGYVCSRQGQGNQTIYELLPGEYHQLKPVGRLDKDSSGLILLTNDGQLANRLTHPRYGKAKVYAVTLDKKLTPDDEKRLEQGVKLEDGISKLQIKNIEGPSFTVVMNEGRNRQIRRTFAALGYDVKKLHRTEFGPYKLDQLPTTGYQVVPFQK